MVNEYSLSSLTVVTPDKVEYNTGVTISGGKIIDFRKSKLKDYSFDNSYLLFPAIINAHDHLFGSYYPKIGNGPYICWLPWDYDLKSSPLYIERNKNSPFDLYMIGSFKNLISGVTTVHDHIPHEINEPYIDRLPIRVLRDYTLAHEVSVYDLKWGNGVVEEYKKAVENDIPFVSHIEEGFDEDSLRGIEVLNECRALGEHTVLIHGIGFSQEDINLIARNRVNFVWCPGSNMYMFGKTARIKELLQAGVNISVGTDSPASGELNILEEVRFAKKMYQEMYEEEIKDELLVKMITVNPAKAFRIYDKLGSIEKNKLGDLLIICGNKKNPYSSLINARLEDISLVFMEGKPIYGDDIFENIFNDLECDYTRVTVNNKGKLITGDPKSLLEKIRKTVGYNKELPFLPL